MLLRGRAECDNRPSEISEEVRRSAFCRMATAPGGEVEAFEEGCVRAGVSGIVIITDVLMPS